MNRLQLATLISWAGKDGFAGRKRLQKVVYFLQNAGCPLDCDFILHHYGPYSFDVADRCDEMVAAGLIDEKGPANGGAQYSYTLKQTTRQLLENAPDAAMQPFQEMGTMLIGQDLWSLELGSTILLFYRQAGDWDHALNRACEFKKVPTDVEQSQQALALAKQFQKKN